MKLLLIAALLACSQVNAQITGDITEDTARVRLNSPVHLHNSNGGNMDVAIDIGDTIRASGSDTYVSGYCHSACALMFLAGGKRVVHKDAVIGFHGPTEHWGTHWSVVPPATRALVYFQHMVPSFPREEAQRIFYETRGQQIVIFTPKQALAAGIATHIFGE